MNDYYTATAINNPGKGEMAEYIHLEPVFLCIEAAVASAAQIGAETIQVHDHVGLVATADGDGRNIHTY